LIRTILPPTDKIFVIVTDHVGGKERKELIVKIRFAESVKYDEFINNLSDIGSKMKGPD
jgi:hypothetical protein